MSHYRNCHFPVERRAQLLAAIDAIMDELETGTLAAPVTVSAHGMARALGLYVSSASLELAKSFCHRKTMALFPGSAI